MMVVTSYVAWFATIVLRKIQEADPEGAELKISRDKVGQESRLAVATSKMSS